MSESRQTRDLAAATEAAAIQDLEFQKVDEAALPAWLQTMSTWIWRVFSALGALAVLALLVTVIADVSMRTITGRSILGANDMVSSWWMVSIAFLGIALAQHSEGRIQIDFMIDALAGRLRKVVDAVVLLLTMAIGLLLAWAGWLEAMHQFEVGEYAPIGERPIWPFRFLVPVSLFAFALACFLELLQLLWQRNGAKDVAHV